MDFRAICWRTRRNHGEPVGMEDSGETGFLEDDIGGTFDSDIDVGMGGGVGRKLECVCWQFMYRLFVPVALGT